MVQPACRPVEMPEQPKPLSLAQRIEAEFPIGVGHSPEKPEPTVSSMAERFAPDALQAARARMARPLVADAALPAALQEPGFFSTPTRGVIFVLTAVAIAPAAILAGLLWFGALRGPSTETGEHAAPPTHQATAAVAPVLRVTPAVADIVLTAPEEIQANAGEVVGFAIAIDTNSALPARSVIAIRGLPEGAVFSRGRPFGAHEWSLRPDETAGLTLQVPEDQDGGRDLEIELVTADGTVLARTATRLVVASAPAAGLVVRSGETDRIETLIDHGDAMIAVGYFAGARAYYERAAQAGSGDAALAVGATYDPAFIAALGVQGIKPDREAAQTWYDRATALGVSDRGAQLAALKRTWTQTGEALSESPAAGAQPVQEARPSQPKSEPEPGPLGRLVAAASELTTRDEWVEVSSAVNVRKGPSSEDEPFKVAQKGTKLRVMERDGNWVHIADPTTKQEGWIYARFLKETDAP